MALLTVQCASDNDDAVEFQDDTGFDSAGNSISIQSGSSPDTATIAGFRFANITIGSGVTIVDAWLEFYVHASSDANLDIYADVDSASPDDFSDNPDVVNRTLSSASEAWIEAGILADNWMPSPSIKEVVEEILALPGWASGNAMTFLLKGKNAVTEQLRVRTHDFDAASAAKLNIEYQTVAADLSLFRRPTTKRPIYRR